MWIWGTVCQYRTVFHLQYQCISVRSELPSFSNCERHWPVEHCKPGPFNRSKLCEMWSVEWLHAYIFLHDTDAIHFKIHSKEYKFWLLSGSPLGWGGVPTKTHSSFRYICARGISSPPYLVADKERNHNVMTFSFLHWCWEFPLEQEQVYWLAQGHFSRSDARDTCRIEGWSSVLTIRMPTLWITSELQKKWESKRE